MSTHLLLVDPQNDFCDLPPNWWPVQPLLDGAPRVPPALPVVGAHADMQRAAAWLRTHMDQVDAITITLDSHQRFDIAHPDFWQHGDSGQPVEPFTAITAAQVRAGQYLPRVEHYTERALAYLDALEAQNRYTLMVWPVHCEVGSPGHNIHPSILAACSQWQIQRQRAVYSVFKGMNPWTEHYSALRAEVADPCDPATQLNQALLDRLAQAQRLIIAGQASTHCVLATTEDLLTHMPDGYARRMVLLTDCMHPVHGFQHLHTQFLVRMARAGAQLVESTRFSL